MPDPIGPPKPTVYYYRDPTGRAVQTTDEDLARSMTSGPGAKGLSKEEAESSASASSNLSHVDQNWGMAGKLGMGLASGLTLGVGPGLAASAGLVDPGHLRAAQTSPLYTIGDVAGTALPALFSGGESLAAKGIGMTPAGVLESLGSGTERLVGGLLGEGSGVLGKAIAAPARMAARGAVDGALINIGHTAGQNLLDNVPLAAESLLAAGLDGALAGGLIGGSLGAVGSIASLGAEKVGGYVKGAGGGKYAEGIALKRLGLSAEEVAVSSETGVTSKELLKNAGGIVEKGGAKLGDSDAEVSAAIKKGTYETVEERAALVQRLDKESPVIAPSVERVQAQIDSIVAAKYADSGLESDIFKVIQKEKERLNSLTSFQELEPVKVAAKPAPKDWYGPTNQRPAATEGYEIMGGKFPTGELPTWQKWVQTRDLLEKELKNASKGPLSEVRREVLNVIDGEINAAMESASNSVESLAGAQAKYAALTTQAKIGEILEHSFGRREANKLMSAGTGLGISVEEGAYAGLMAANGSPVAALAFMAGKGIMRLGKERLEPAIAQAVYDMSIGTKAANSVSHVKSSIGTSVKKFFKEATKTPSTSAQVYRSEKSPAKYRSKESAEKFSRKSYEETYSKTEQLLSANHQDRVRRYAETLQQMGYQALALQLMMTNQRAVQYLSFNLPARMSAQGMTSLRKQPVPKTLTMPEYKFMRVLEGVADPKSILKDLESGKLSQDKVKAIKYVYPEFHREIVSEVSGQIYQAKMEGQFMSMSKIANLGIMLDSPVDSTLTPEYIGAVQTALATPPPSDNSEQGPAAPMNGPSNFSASFMTPLQANTL